VGTGVLALTAAAGLWLGASASASGPEPWLAAGDIERALTDAEAALVLGSPEEAQAEVHSAGRAVEALLEGESVGAGRAAVARAAKAARAADEPALAAARAEVRAIILRASFREAVRATARGDVSHARAWLLVREFRPPTRFSRAAADATLALDELAEGTMTPARAAAIVRRDLLDTYDARLRTALSSMREADQLGFDATRAEMGALAHGYWQLLAPVYSAHRGLQAEEKLAAAFARLASLSLHGGPVVPRAASIEQALSRFRAVPLFQAELVRRAGQLDRFLQLVPIEYDRGVEEGRVTLEFEIQEAITFRDGAGAAFHDLQPALAARDAGATRELGRALEALGGSLADAERGGAVASPERVRATTETALSAIGSLYPSEWKEAGKTADFDVISTTIDRLEAAVAAGNWKQAESARLEAYGVFELGPEQRLRGLAPSLFQEIEGYFWYGAGGRDGLVQLIKRRAGAQELAATRAALDEALGEAKAQIGSGGSNVSVAINSAVIVFREGLEALLILAALMASLVGQQRRFRRPMFIGVGVALVASALTWVVAQTVLTSLQRYGEKLEAIVSLVAIGVLLLILNWFYHRVYWQGNLQDLHRKKRRILAGAGLSLVAAQVVGLVLLGFSSVYREGFETVLFLQAMTLKTGPLPVLEGVALGVVAMFVLVIALERRLPHKKMLIATGALITWVVVVMVGTTVQTMQKVGWLAVTPIEGLELPYWTGLWLGLYPSWQGVLAQAAAAAFVLGSYFVAEGLRKRRRARVIAAPLARRALPFSTPASRSSISRDAGGPGQ
jgi:high-affinity iron transporter